MLYALADRQLTAADPTHPRRGLYVGVSAMYAPPELNLFSQYYEARLYAFGPFDARPGDFTSLVISYESYSKEGQEALAPPKFGSSSETTSVIGSYAFHVRPGLYIQPGLGVTTHPSVSREFNNVLNAYLTVSAFF
jgi:porin